MQVQRISSSQPYSYGKMSNQNKSHSVTFGSNFNPNTVYGLRADFINSVKGAGIRKIRPNSYITVSGLNIDDCKVLKDNGIERIIDLSNYSFLKGNAERAGLEYRFINIFENTDDGTDFTNHDIFRPKIADLPKSQKLIRTFVDKFIELVNLVKKDNAFVCTDNRTALVPYGPTSGFYDLILAFDRKEVLDKFGVENLYISDIYKNLTAADKKALGFDAISDRNFRESLPLSRKEKEALETGI